MPRKPQTQPRPGTDAAAHERPENHAVIAVYGLACRGCAWRVQRAVRSADGVAECVVNPLAETVSIHFDPEKVNTEGLLELIRGTGLEPRLARMTVPVPDLLHAPSAARRVLAAITGISGTSAAAASAIGGGFVVEFDAGRVDRESVLRVVRANGFETGAPVLHSEAAAVAQRHGGLATLFAFLATLGAIVVASARVVDLASPATAWLAPVAALTPLYAALLTFALAAATVACAAPLLRRGFRRLLKGRVDENSLLAAGLVALIATAAVDAFVAGHLAPLAATAAATVAVLFRRWLTLRRVAAMPEDRHATHPFQNDAFALRPGAAVGQARRDASRAVLLMLLLVVIGSVASFLTHGSIAHALLTGLAALVAGFGGALASGTERLFADSVRSLHARGIFPADGETLETASMVRRVLADEETFYRPVPEISDYVLLRGETQLGLLRRAAMAFAGSPHPLAVAVRAKAGSTEGETPFVLESADPGRGVKGKVGRRDLVAGIPEYLIENGVDASDAAEEIARFSAERKRTIGVALDGRLDGVIALLEPLREGARTAVETLRAAGVDTIYATTDAETLANAHVAPLALTRTTLLRDRAQRVEVARRMRDESPTALAIGREGEAAMLRTGDLGIALGDGASLLAAADVVIPSASPVAITHLLTEARSVVARAAQSRRLWLALQVTAVAAPLVAGVAGAAAYAPLAAAGVALIGTIVILRATRHA